MLARWYDKVDNGSFSSFNTIVGTICEHCDEMLNYFVSRSTNAFAKSFNAKIKAFGAQLRGVADLNFFFYRLIKFFLDQLQKLRGKNKCSIFAVKKIQIS